MRTGFIQFFNNTGKFTRLRASQGMTASYDLTLPPTLPQTAKFLQVSPQGILSWQDASLDTSIYALKSELPDLTPYALKSELPSLSGYALQSSLGDLQASLGNYTLLSTHNADKATLQGSVDSLGARVSSLETNPSWVTLTPASGWTTVSTVQTCSKGGVVYMRGSISENGTNGITNGSTVLTLPTGYRPTVALVGLPTDQAGAHDARVDVATNGNISVFWDSSKGYPGFGGNKIYLSFAGVIFPTW